MSSRAKETFCKPNLKTKKLTMSKILLVLIKKYNLDVNYTHVSLTCIQNPAKHLWYSFLGKLPLTIFVNSSILDAWQGSEYASV